MYSTQEGHKRDFFKKKGVGNNVQKKISYEYNEICRYKKNFNTHVLHFKDFYTLVLISF